MFTYDRHVTKRVVTLLVLMLTVGSTPAPVTESGASGIGLTTSGASVQRKLEAPGERRNNSVSGADHVSRNRSSNYRIPASRKPVTDVRLLEERSTASQALENDANETSSWNADRVYRQNDVTSAPVTVSPTGSSPPEANDRRKGAGPRQSRHLDGRVNDGRSSSRYSRHDVIQGSDDVILDGDDRIVKGLLGVAKCRTICPNQCWHTCSEVYNNRSLCAITRDPENKSFRNNSISLPCTLYERLPAHRLPVCQGKERRHLVDMTVTYTPIPSELVITWSITAATSSSYQDYAPVIVVFWRDKIQTSWYYLNMYRTRNVKIPVKESIENFEDLDFLLVAVGPSCILDKQIIEVPDEVLHSRNNSTYHVTRDHRMSKSAGQLMADGGHIELSRDQKAPFSFHLAADVQNKPDGGLHVTVTWIVPEWLTGDDVDTIRQTVFWARMSCDPPTGYTSCGGDTKLYSYIKTGTSTGLDKNELVLTDFSNMTYNSVYWVVVKLNDNTYRSRQYNFSTLPCDQPTAAFTKCLPKPVCSQNDSCGAKSATDFLSWEINLTCWQRDREPERREVKVHLTWSEPPTEATITEYTLLCEALSGGRKIQRLTERSTEIYLQLDTFYQIKLLAKLSGSEGPSLVRAQPFYVNTSQDSLHQMWPQCETLQAKGSGSPLGIIMAVAGGFIMAIVIILVIYKKRDSFREIIIDKATVVKSNSYKSTLGAYSDLKDQKNILSDGESWEIDPHQVALGSELGHGAFGRVLVGHYKDEKVAIKILKDGAPFFQRDDLLREIHVMQNLGSHPNIIGFVGACTQSEPIALIMEYMPYGNLQQFLKRFRAEGELYHSSDGYRLVYQSVDQLGSDDKWCLGPTDFLSYARQIAIAMEYLSDRQYVHRDLAARNVLVGYNKTVKLCDFGLARLVYSNDQYYRLTGGRLPIRWMALESLRDRIYTSKSDVWAYGIFLWELVTLGCCPYPNISLGELFNKLSEGYRMEQPRNCSHELYDLMSQCWCENPSDRPTFTHLRLQLEMLLSRNMNYLALDNLDFSYQSSEASDHTAPFDISLESLVTDNELTVTEISSGQRSIKSTPTGESLRGVTEHELQESLLSHSPECSTRRSAERSNVNRTLSTWSLDSDDLKHWLRIHTLTKSTLSLADLQNSYSQFSGRTLVPHGSTSSEIHTLSTVV